MAKLPAAAILMSLSFAVWAQQPAAPVPQPDPASSPASANSPDKEIQPKVNAAEIGKAVSREGCEYKPVMSDDDLRKCGITPPRYPPRPPLA
jgi:hypothetical protein